MVSLILNSLRANLKTSAFQTQNAMSKTAARKESACQLVNLPGNGNKGKQLEENERQAAQTGRGRGRGRARTWPLYWRSGDKSG